MTNDISQLARELNSSDAELRRQTLEQLSRDTDLAKRLAVQIAERTADEDEGVRNWATETLEGMGAPDVTQLSELRKLLDHQESDCAYWAATLLGRLGPVAVEAVPDLVRILEKHDVLAVRERAAWSLGEMGPAAHQVLPDLEAVAQNSPPRLARLLQNAIQRISGSNSNE